METHKVKEEVMEQDTDQMTVYQFYYSRRNTFASDAPHMNKQRKPLETKKEHEWAMKRPSSLTNKNKQLISHDMEEYASYKRTRASVNPFYGQLEAESPVVKRAKEIQANLAPEFPSFIKTMIPSYVSRGFLMRLPKEFCDLHLPRHDATVHLVNESGEEYMVKFLLGRHTKYALSGGWRKFSITNKLFESDVLVFQLVKPSNFKVFVVRANSPAEVDGAPGLMKSARYNQKTALVDQFYEHLEADSPVVERAKEIQANLAPEFPSFLKTMLYSHVKSGFWMRLPKEFCHLHLPRNDATLHLTNESGGDYKVNYLVDTKATRCALSGGWRKFSTVNKLVEGDVLIFQLVKPSKFKVYIVRANGLAKVDGALSLLNLDAYANQVHFKEKIVRSLPINVVRENIQQNYPMVLKTDLPDQSETDSEDPGSTNTSGFLVDFKKVESIENFTIFVNGSTIKSELSEYHRTKYYELCCTQRSFLHNHLHKTIKRKLAAEIISQTVNIADAIRACNLSTSQHDYSIWDSTLERFELLGMDVGFIRAKVSRLSSVAFESKEAVYSKRFREGRLQQSCAEDEIRTLELKLLELKETAKKIGFEMESIEVNADRHELMFQEELNAPW